MTALLYLDAAASAPLEPRVLEATINELQAEQANPSASHGPGRRAQQRVEDAREQVAALTCSGPAGVVFTSGATEANALALRGLEPNANRSVIVSCTTEHPSVLAQLDVLLQAGRQVRMVGVNRHGEVDMEALRAAVGEDTLLVSVMSANNETGVLADLAQVSNVAHEVGALVHSDASQLMAWGPLSEELDLDLVTVSGHKMHGPQGTGALVVSRRARRFMRPLLPGGGQERGLRSGTYNVAGIVGLGMAAELAGQDGPAAAPVVRRLRDLLHEQLTTLLPFSQLNGHPQRRLPNVLNLALGQSGDEVDAQAVLAHVPWLAASTGSACSAGTPEPSPVLRAMGLGAARAASSIRLSLSRLSEERDVLAAVPLLADAVLAVRQRQADRQQVPV